VLAWNYTVCLSVLEIHQLKIQKHCKENEEKTAMELFPGIRGSKE